MVSSNAIEDADELSAWRAWEDMIQTNRVDIIVSGDVEPVDIQPALEESGNTSSAGAGTTILSPASARDGQSSCRTTTSKSKPIGDHLSIGDS